MALALTDWVAVSRGGQVYKGALSSFINLVTDNIGTTERSVADITERDAISGQTLGDRVIVDDASADATVNAGWAIYTWNGSNWVKVAEEEGLDVVLTHTDLGITRTATGNTITNTDGTDATIPLADSTFAGLLSPAEKEKIGYLLVTSNVDLDDLNTKSHLAVTTSGSQQTNPISVDSNQVVSFIIEQLDTLP